ncbi:glycosyltransferase [Bacteroides caecigallinarum]|nr:glycosyltransferase [Bacteroides caecigallinarum]
MRSFSVLISLYFKEHPSYLIQSLNSIFTQTLLPNEVVIVKDGTLTLELDKTVSEYEKRYSQIKVISLEKNQGLGKALNEGLKHCSFDLIARMDTDDIAYPDRFEKQVKFMTEHPEIDACSSWIDEFIDSTDNIVSTKKLPETDEEIKRYAKLRSPLNHPAVMFRKQAVINVGGYKHFYLFEDYYLWVRMIMNESKMYNLQESLLYFRYSPEMIKRRGGWKYAKSEINLQKEFYRIGFIGLGTFMKNIAIRLSVRMIPNELRDFIYKKFLRKK